MFDSQYWIPESVQAQLGKAIFLLIWHVPLCAFLLFSVLLEITKTDSLLIDWVNSFVHCSHTHAIWLENKMSRKSLFYKKKLIKIFYLQRENRNVFPFILHFFFHFPFLSLLYLPLDNPRYMKWGQNTAIFNIEYNYGRLQHGILLNRDTGKRI